MSMGLLVDTIALQLTLKDKETDNITTKVYILYDKKCNNYIIHGCNYILQQKHNKYDINLNPATKNKYSFICENVMSIYYFISTIILNNYIAITLLSYKKMFNDSKRITYEYLNYVNKNKRIISSKQYDNDYKKDDILIYLSVIKDFTNIY